jgi:hypothetical protein
VAVVTMQSASSVSSSIIGYCCIPCINGNTRGSGSLRGPVIGCMTCKAEHLGWMICKDEDLGLSTSVPRATSTFIVQYLEIFVRNAKPLAEST